MSSHNEDNDEGIPFISYPKIDLINFDNFLMMTNSDINVQKENVDVFNVSKQGMQGACLNET
jgi:hypothetical protein